MSDMIEVKVDELSGAALDWAVAVSLGGKYQPYQFGSNIDAPFWDAWVFPDGCAHSIFDPSDNWAKGGPLIDKYGVLLSPPKSMVHRNYGNFDKRNGWYESGVWGATIFGKERKYRRRSFEHPDQPLVAAMRAIVQFELGDVVSVPAALVEGGAQ